MQKFDFKYKQHELDDVNIRTIYEANYEAAVEDFIDWIHHHGYIGYFDDKTVIGNPVYRSHVDYKDNLSKSSVNVYVLQYTLLNYQTDLRDPTEQKKVQLYMSDAIDDFIAAIRDLKTRENIKNLVTYKGTLDEFDINQINL
jgi:hypothetical protein